MGGKYLKRLRNNHVQIKQPVKRECSGKTSNSSANYDNILLASSSTRLSSDAWKRRSGFGSGSGWSLKPIRLVARKWPSFRMVW